MQWDYKAHLCQHRSWTGALEGALRGLSVLPESVDPDKTSVFVPTSSSQLSFAYYILTKVLLGCAIIVLRQEMPHIRLESWFRDNFGSPHSFLEPFTEKKCDAFPRCLNPTSFSHNPQASPAPTMKNICFLWLFLKPIGHSISVDWLL